MADGFALGTLRWQVQLLTREQAAVAGNTGIVETAIKGATFHASIDPIGSITFWGAQQTDTPVTHRIRMRWTDYTDNTHVILRQTNLPDGNVRVETFRVRRVKEVGGRKRFVEFEVELEKSV